jgi:hypothetical protein
MQSSGLKSLLFQFVLRTLRIRNYLNTLKIKSATARQSWPITRTGASAVLQYADRMAAQQIVILVQFIKKTVKISLRDGKL